MNRATAFAEETIGGYIGRFRLAWRSEAFKVREHREGRVLYFTTAEEAELAAWRVKHKIEDRHMRREGETLMAHRQAAEMLFRPGKKPIPVETRRRA